MVRIVNGEIVAEDDVRAQQSGRRDAASPSRPAASSRAPANPSTPGEPWWQRTPFRVLYDQPVGGRQFMGLPDIEVFGNRVPALHVLIMAGLGVVAGWRMLAFILMLYIVVKVNNSPLAARPEAADGSGANPAGAASDFLKDYMQRNPASSSPGGAASGGQSTVRDAWANRGKGNKLGSAAS